MENFHQCKVFIYFSLQVPVEKKWTEKLMYEYKSYLEAYHKEQKTVRKHLLDALAVFVDMDKSIMFAHELSYEWLENDFKINQTGVAKRSLRAFLVNINLIKQPDEEIRYVEAFKKSVMECPAGFRKAITLYYEEKLGLRKRQIEQNARSPLNLKTIEADVGVLKRMVKWVVEQYPNTKSWFDVTEEKANYFLLSLTPSSRESKRKDIYQFFKLAKRKRCIFDIPLTDFKTREVSRVAYVLSFAEQSQFARKINAEGLTIPYEALLSSLFFYHAMQLRYATSIKLTDIDVENMRIKMKDVPDVYLLTIEMVILKEYLLIRKEFPNSYAKEHLFISRQRGTYGDIAMSKETINKMVKKFSGFSPKTLRITCLTAMANYNGPQFLREAYGISQTHAGRFGKYEDYLIEETLIELLK